MSRIFVYTEGQAEEWCEPWYGVEQYIQNINPVGKNKSTLKNQPTGAPLSTCYMFIIVLITVENSGEVWKFFLKHIVSLLRQTWMQTCY